MSGLTVMYSIIKVCFICDLISLFPLVTKALLYEVFAQK